jgi:hypothetical protein
MRTRFIALLASALLAIAADPAAAPLPELKLTNGTVFRNVTVVRYDRETVTLKSNAGTGPIRYAMLPEPIRVKFIAERDAALMIAAEKAVPPPAKPRTLTGQVYVTTRGAGAYKFSEVTVTAYPKVNYEQISGLVRVRTTVSTPELYKVAAWKKELADVKPIATATTDADGRFTLTLPADASQVFLFGTTTRLLATGRTELNLWSIPVPDDAATFDLNSSNLLQ